VLFLLYRLLQDSQAQRFFNFLRYPTFRIVAAGVAALLIGLFWGRQFIEQLRQTQHGQSNIREDTPDRHQTKKGTPTMGGAMILVCIGLATLLFADLSSRVVSGSRCSGPSATASSASSTTG
jgi:phospho-N-acetylmuramoyl-pentapeptide-transferase